MKIEVSNGELLDKISILELKLLKIEDEDKLVNKIPELKTLIGNSLEKIPSLYPATKTNMGIPVSSKFSLPLIIKSN